MGWGCEGLGGGFRGVAVVDAGDGWAAGAPGPGAAGGGLGWGVPAVGLVAGVVGGGGGDVGAGEALALAVARDVDTGG